MDELPERSAAWVASLLQGLVPLDEGAVVERIGRGWDCDVYEVRGADQRHVVRVACNADAARGLRREALYLAPLSAQLPLPTAAPRHVGELDGGGAFALYRFLPGVALCEVELWPEDYRQLAGELGGFLRSLHGAELPGGLQLPLDERGRLDATQRSESSRQMLEQLLWEGALTRGERARLEGALDEAEPLALGARQVPLHGDLHPCNLLVDEDGFSGVIDWIDVHAGHPAVDLSTAYLSFVEPSRAALFDAYGAVDDATLAWARWRAITVLTATVRGAMARGWGERSHAASRQLAVLGRES